MQLGVLVVHFPHNKFEVEEVSLLVRSCDLLIILITDYALLRRLDSSISLIKKSGRQHRFRRFPQLTVPRSYSPTARPLLPSTDSQDPWIGRGAAGTVDKNALVQYPSSNLFHTDGTCAKHIVPRNERHWFFACHAYPIFRREFLIVSYARSPLRIENNNTAKFISFRDLKH